MCVPLPPWKCVLSLREVPRGRKLWWSANTHRVSHSVSDGFLADAETSTRNTAGQHVHMLPLWKTPMFVSIMLCSFKNSPDKSFLSPLSFSFSRSHTQMHKHTHTHTLFCCYVKRYWASQTEPCFLKQAKSNLIRLGRM